MGKQQQDDENVVTVEREILPPWIAALRGVAARVVRPEDLEEIVRSQLKKAKDGDRHAIQFVFGQLANAACPKGMTLIQNNFIEGHNGKRAKALGPVKAPPGSKEKVEAMRLRVQAEMAPTNLEDAPADTEA